MLTYKNADIARKYNVDRSTVTHWVSGALAHKNNLELNDLNKIIDNSHNQSELERLADDAKSFKRANKKVVEVDMSVFSAYTEDEIITIISDLQYQSSFNRKFGYKGVGAELWDKYYLQNISHISQSNLHLLDKLYQISSDYIGKNKVSVIDFGAGNGYPVKTFLHDNPKLSSYIAVDISQDMLNISTKNVKSWFPGIDVKGYVRDFENSQFGKLLYENRVEQGINFIVYADIICNHDDRQTVLKNIRSGMIENDLFAVTYSFDSNEARTGFSYANDIDSTMRQAWLLEAIGIDLKSCQAVNRYESDLKAKVKYVKLDKAYTLKFTLLGKTRIVDLIQGQEISVWRHYLPTKLQVIEELETAGFEVLSLTQDPKVDNCLIVCKANL